MKAPFICLLVGPSGSGKTTIANILCNRNGWSQVASYTTRPPRHAFEEGHTFITEDDFKQLTDIVAYTYYNDHHYCATAQQIDNCEVYVVDIPGVETLVNTYKGKKNFIVFIPWIDEDSRRMRMFQRGDSLDKINERTEVDREAFAESWRLGELVGEENVHLLEFDTSEENAKDAEEFLRLKGYTWEII